MYLIFSLIKMGIKRKFKILSKLEKDVINVETYRLVEFNDKVLLEINKRIKILYGENYVVSKNLFTKKRNVKLQIKKIKESQNNETLREELLTLFDLYVVFKNDIFFKDEIRLFEDFYKEMKILDLKIMSNIDDLSSKKKIIS